MTHEELNIRDLLARLFRKEKDRDRLMDQAGIDTLRMALGDSALNDWHEIIRCVSLQKQMPDLLKAASAEFPNDERIKAALEGQLTAARGPELPEQPAPTDAVLERITQGASTMLPIYFLSEGLRCAASVVRIVWPNGKANGTGFLIQDNWLLTNNHVLKNLKDATEARIQFNYQETFGSAKLDPIEMKTDAAAGFHTSVEHDWAAVKMPPAASEQFGCLPLEEHDVKVNDFVNIIQHPMGAPKAIALYHNLVIATPPEFVHYLTDTEPGSSGSPVFDSEWNIVALHHAGRTQAGADGKMLTFNEGIAIRTVIADLRTAGVLS